jgi:tRNA G18 (ribose-2'-O)-methylase SpoU
MIKLHSMRKLEYEEQILKKLPAEEYHNIDRNPFYVLLDNIRSVHNVGAMFRTADATLVKKIFLSGFTATPPREDLAKTALVTLRAVPWEYHQDPINLVKKLKKEGIKVVSLEITDQSLDYTKTSYEFPLLLIVGNELTGIREELIDLSDTAVKIPMLGKANSLNVATSFGVALYEILRQYNLK